MFDWKFLFCFLFFLDEVDVELSTRFCIASSWRALAAQAQRELLRQKRSSSLSARFKLHFRINSKLF
jgi:hypothetical protein